MALLFDDAKVAAAAAGLSLSPPAPGALAARSHQGTSYVDPTAAVDLSSAFADEGHDTTVMSNACDVTKVCDVLSFMVTSPNRQALDPADLELFTPRGDRDETAAASPTQVIAIHGLSVSPQHPADAENEKQHVVDTPAHYDNDVLLVQEPAPPVTQTVVLPHVEDAIERQKEVWAQALEQQQQKDELPTTMSLQLSPDFHSMVCSPQNGAVATAVPSRNGQAALLAQLGATPVSKKPQADDEEREELPLVHPEQVVPQLVVPVAALAPAAKSQEEEPCCFLRVKLVDPASVGMAPLKLKVPHSIRFAKLLEHRVMRQVFALHDDENDLESFCVLTWHGQQLDLSMSPKDIAMPTGIGAVQTLEAMSQRTVRETAHEMELRLQLREAKAKSELLEFQLRRQTSSSAASPSNTSHATSHPPQVPEHINLERDLIEAAKRRSAREYAKEKQQEAAYWKQQFECAVQELAMIKVLVAQQAAALDRIGVPSSPFPDSIVGSAFVHKSFSFDGSVSPCFAPM